MLHTVTEICGQNTCSSSLHSSIREQQTADGFEYFLVISTRSLKVFPYNQPPADTCGLLPMSLPKVLTRQLLAQV